MTYPLRLQMIKMMMMMTLLMSTRVNMFLMMMMMKSLAMMGSISFITPSIIISTHMGMMRTTIYLLLPPRIPRVSQDSITKRTYHRYIIIIIILTIVTIITLIFCRGYWLWFIAFHDFWWRRSVQLLDDWWQLLQRCCWQLLPWRRGWPGDGATGGLLITMITLTDDRFHITSSHLIFSCLPI